MSAIELSFQWHFKGQRWKDSRPRQQMMFGRKICGSSLVFLSARANLGRHQNVASSPAKQQATVRVFDGRIHYFVHSTWACESFIARGHEVNFVKMSKINKVR